MVIKKFGSIYLSGKAQMPGVDCDGSANISFGDTVLGKELQWVKLKNGLLVADRCVCTGISWKQLNEKGLVFGVLITIDNETYLCRCLQIGAKEDEPNEWDAVLDEAGEDHELLHWNDALFWGQEVPSNWASHRAVRGWNSARFWYYHNATSRHVSVGFRPVLEYLGSVPCSPDTLVGKTIKVYCTSDVTIEGHLVDFSDYDVVLRANSPLLADYPWSVKEGNNIIVNRENINWLKKA